MALNLHKPCSSELTLLGPNAQCDLCRYYAHEHPYWPHKNPEHVNFNVHVHKEYLRLSEDLEPPR